MSAAGVLYVEKYVAMSANLHVSECYINSLALLSVCWAAQVVAGALEHRILSSYALTQPRLGPYTIDVTTDTSALLNVSIAGTEGMRVHLLPLADTQARV